MGRRRNSAKPDAASRGASAEGDYAALDLGTNSCRLLIAQRAPEGFRVVDGFSRIVRLGEGLAATGELQEPAMARTIAALKICAEKIVRRRVGAVRCVATAACRHGANGEKFIDRVARETGLKLKCIDADAEARLTLSGCAPLLNSGHKRGILFDIGGGSTEVIWVRTRPGGELGAKPEAIDIQSLPFGVVSLAEEFGTAELAPDAFEAMVASVDSDLADFCARHGIAEAVSAGDVQMIGTSGTVTTLGALLLGLPTYDRNRVDGLVMDMASVRAIAARLSSMDDDARQELPCVGRGRADLMIMGCVILTAIARRWPVPSLRAADRGIREGLIMEMIAAELDDEGTVAPAV